MSESSSGSRGLYYEAEFAVIESVRSEIKEKMTTGNVNLSDSVTEEDAPTDTARGSKDEDSVLKMGQKNTVVWRYIG
ncbi:Hypothetical protein SMAX5B_006514 [Scophthalmus maximus]|uniref:Uncharacterized protein n=1 Tax=Scophthalmus maximus TaxID=52904 RepID=A0A2U9BKI6_SCOMX|nr:Hypothetical protein SMAX5B_006514 [Scophthalmus maximus]